MSLFPDYAQDYEHPLPYAVTRLRDEYESIHSCIISYVPEGPAREHAIAFLLASAKLAIDEAQRHETAEEELRAKHRVDPPREVKRAAALWLDAVAAWPELSSTGYGEPAS